ncbi:hypothetical protein MBLNU459_g5147t2 [Dothideomycetes sp. NU459]
MSEATKDRAQSTSNSASQSPSYTVTDDAIPLHPRKKSLVSSLRPQPQGSRRQRTFSAGGHDQPSKSSLMESPGRRASLGRRGINTSPSAATTPHFAPISPTDHRKHVETHLPLIHRHRTSDASASGKQLTPSKGFAAVTAAFSRSSNAHPSRPSAPNQYSGSEPQAVSHVHLQISSPRLAEESGERQPTDETHRVLSTAEKKPSLLAGVLDQRRESRAKKRREELKRTIRVVPLVRGMDEAERDHDGQWI